jgi:hypothetical protein
MAIYPCLRSLPPQRAELPEEPAIGVEFARGSKPTHKSSAQTAWMRTRFASPGLSFPSSISFVTKATARISRPDVGFGSKADMCGALAHVCFGPIADMTKFW